MLIEADILILNVEQLTGAGDDKLEYLDFLRLSNSVASASNLIIRRL